MKILNKIRAAALALLAAVSFSACSIGDPDIVAFAFTKSDNSALSSTVYGSIDTDLKVVTVALPSDVYTDSTIRASLKATISIENGASFVTDVSKLDFSTSPVVLSLTTKKGDISTYQIEIEEEHEAVKVGKLLISEYYSGEELPYRGVNNQYIELYNNSNATIDLGSVKLTRHAWEKGSRVESQDRTVTLSGSLPSGGTAVIYSSRCSYFNEAVSTASKLYISDQSLNSIITFNGVDGLEMTSNGTVLDVLGPNEGYGSGWSWGTAKKMQRKATVKTYKKWSDNEWLVSSVSNDATSDAIATTAGVATSTVDSSTKNVTYFALEGLSDIIYGKIDNSAYTVTISLPLAYGTTQKITASTDGQKIRVQQGSTKKDIVSGETEVDFSKDLTLITVDNTGATQNYDVVCNLVDYKFSNSPAGSYKLMSEKPETGDVVILYCPSKSYAVGSTASGSKLAAVAPEFSYDGLEYESGIASLTVTVTSEGYYVFTCNKKYLTSPSSGNGLSLEDSPTDYCLWKLEDAGSGLYYIVNVNAKRSAKGDCALEYYSGFSTYNSYSGNVIYQFEIYKK